MIEGLFAEGSDSLKALKFSLGKIKGTADSSAQDMAVIDGALADWMAFLEELTLNPKP